MLTAAITAAITAILALFGVTPSVGQVAGIAVVVKVIIVCTGLFVAARLARRRRSAAPPVDEAKAPTPPGNP